MVAEVLSPMTRDRDTFARRTEYRHVESLDTIVVVRTDTPEVVVRSRGQGRSWVRHIVEGIDREVDMPAIGGTLPLAQIYDGVALPARPRPARLVEPRGETTADSADPPPAEPG